MNNRQALKILKTLTEKTLLDEVSWHETASEDAFRSDFEKYIIEISTDSELAPERHYSARILDNDGNTLTELDADDTTSTPWRVLGELFLLARDRALAIPDEPLDRFSPSPGIPMGWQDFEEICCDLWSKIWGDPSTFRSARQGQPQAGVDICGRPHKDGQWTGNWAGVQCKAKRRGVSLVRQEIEVEIQKAKNFHPKLTSFTIATTAPKDDSARKTVHEIAKAHQEGNGFEVHLAFWDDIVRLMTKYPEVLAKHYPEFELKAADQEDYLRALWARLFPVPMLGIGAAGRHEDIPLADVYTALDVTSEIGVGMRGSEAYEVLEKPVGFGSDEGYLKKLQRRVLREASDMAEAPRPTEAEAYRRRLTAVEAVAAAPRLVLLGPAGSGKSTFVRYLALCLVGERLGRLEANLGRLNGLVNGNQSNGEDLLPWPHGVPLPVLVEPRKLVRSVHFPGPGEVGQAGHLLAYFKAEGELGAALLQAFRDPGGVLLILDGLDETPSAEACRERLKDMITSFSRRYPETRILVTSRPYAYEEGSPWRLDEAGFEEATLAPFSKEKSRAYVQGWYRFLAKRGMIDAEQAERRSVELWQEIRSTPYLMPLAERPLMLTMMADLHASAGGRLRGGRAGLYERSVELLLDRWNQLREVDAQSIVDLLGMDVEQIRQALERLAYEVHRDRGAEEATEIKDAELWKALDRERSRDRLVDERRVMDYLHQRSGILLAESPELYRFPHRSYQEFMAAGHLARTRFPDLLLAEIQADPVLWREVTLLVFGKVATMPFTAWALVDRLVPGTPSADAADPGFLQALFAALGIEENRLWQNIQAQDAPRLERVRQWLERILEIGALSPLDRASAGRVLARLGDRRHGVGLHHEGLPDIDWVEIPAGSFYLGPDPGPASKAASAQVSLGAYHISRYPVTNAQYQAFLKDGGYTSTWRRCWTQAGWEWKGERESPGALDSNWLYPNHPRVGVTWFEAEAYCRWLSERLGHAVRLPTEAEWERAARGADGHVYPWGNEFDSGRCNANETGIGQTTAVGAFPNGASAEGVLDLAGNVWEWCLTKWRESYEEVADEDPEGNAVRVVRGGSFALNQKLIRSAVRYGDAPDLFNVTCGFRVCFGAS